MINDELHIKVIYLYLHVSVLLPGLVQHKCVFFRCRLLLVSVPALLMRNYNILIVQVRKTNIPFGEPSYSQTLKIKSSTGLLSKSRLR